MNVREYLLPHWDAWLLWLGYSYLKATMGLGLAILLNWWLLRTPRFKKLFVPGQRAYRWRELWSSFSIMMFWALANVVLIFLSIAWGRPHIDDGLPDLDTWLVSPIWFVGMILITDAGFYWSHRLMHPGGSIRPMHRTHHEYKNPTASGGYLFSWSEGFLMSIVLVLVPYLITSWNIYLGFVFNVISVMWVSFLHSGMQVAEAWSKTPLLKWIYTPDHHLIHHATGAGNYGLYFVFWDRWMGTERAVPIGKWSTETQTTYAKDSEWKLNHQDQPQVS